MILAHHNPESLESVINKLNSDYSNFYIHIDNKSCEMMGSATIQKLRHRKNVYFVESIKTNWGGYSLVKAELILLRKAFEDKENSYFHLISGDDFPLKSIDEMKERFDKEYHDYILWDENDNRRYLIDSYYFYDLYGNHNSQLSTFNSQLNQLSILN